MTSNIGSEHILDVSGDDSKYEVMSASAGGVAIAPARNFSTALMTSFCSTPSAVANCVKSSSFKSSGCKALADQKLPSAIATDYLVDVGYDPVYGARPRSAIQRELETHWRPSC